MTERMSRMSISMCENDGVPSVRTMCSASAAARTSVVMSRRPPACTLLITSSPPASWNGICPWRTSGHPALVDVDAADRQAAVGKREREGEAYAAGSDDSYVWVSRTGY